MARKTNHGFERRKREKARQERAAARRTRKQARSSSGGGLKDDDLDAIPLGPPPVDKATDAEVMAAVERAMNPGAAHQRSGGRGHPGGSRLFVGNLDFGTDEQELRDLFKEKGFTVVEASLVKDRDTGRSRGFAFVELAKPDEAAKAIETLDGTEFNGRDLRINPADQR